MIHGWKLSQTGIHDDILFNAFCCYELWLFTLCTFLNSAWACEKCSMRRRVAQREIET